MQPLHWRIQGAHPAHAPLRDPILSFRHTNFTKPSRLGSPRPPLRGPRPPMRNPGSATALHMILVMCGWKSNVHTNTHCFTTHAWYSQHWLIQPLVIQSTRIKSTMWSEHIQLTPYVKSNTKSNPLAQFDQESLCILVKLSSADCKCHTHISMIFPVAKCKWIHWFVQLTTHNSSSVADPGGAPGVRPPRDPILSFWHTNFTKHNRLRSPHPPTRSTPPYRKSWIHHWSPS